LFATNASNVSLCLAFRRAHRPHVHLLQHGRIDELADDRMDADGLVLDAMPVVSSGRTLAHLDGIVVIAVWPGRPARYAAPAIGGILMRQRWLRLCRGVGIALEANAGFAARGFALPYLERPGARDRSGPASSRDRRRSRGAKRRWSDGPPARIVSPLPRAASAARV